MQIPTMGNNSSDKSGPQQNLQDMQDEYHTCESDHEHTGVQRAEPVHGSCKMSSGPMDERSHPGTLE